VLEEDLEEASAFAESGVLEEEVSAFAESGVLEEDLSEVEKDLSEVEKDLEEEEEEEEGGNHEDEEDEDEEGEIREDPDVTKLDGVVDLDDLDGLAIGPGAAAAPGSTHPPVRFSLFSAPVIVGESLILLPGAIHPPLSGVRLIFCIPILLLPIPIIILAEEDIGRDEEDA